MIELIREWLVGITCGAIIVALADGLSPNGTVRKIGRLTGSLVLVLAMIQPVLRIDSRTFAGILTLSLIHILPQERAAPAALFFSTER